MEKGFPGKTKSVSINCSISLGHGKDRQQVDTQWAILSGIPSYMMAEIRMQNNRGQQEWFTETSPIACLLIELRRVIALIFMGWMSNLIDRPP